MSTKRFKHISCKIRINPNSNEVASALSQSELDEIYNIRERMGISLSHVLTSLVKSGLVNTVGNKTTTQNNQSSDQIDNQPESSTSGEFNNPGELDKDEYTG